MTIYANTAIASEFESVALDNWIEILKRDMAKCLLPAENPEGYILIKKTDSIDIADTAQADELFELEVDNGNLIIKASGKLGAIYGLIECSRRFLGVKDLWFWNDQFFGDRKKGIEIDDSFSYMSKPYDIRLRGWFINDEVLIDTWKVDGDDKMPWLMAFEALMRLGGNMVIPGTDHNSHKYRQAAADMGLKITHHHAEPLGAEIFARRYPELEASYRKYPDLFENLWREAVMEQQEIDTVYNIGFRGQGDRPFWLDDPSYDTDAKRGELISSLIKKQYDLVKSIRPDAICCSNLYGETMELYKDGFLKLPEDVILIWADNGYGRMVSRRQGSHDPRVPALPQKGAAGRHGVYYHVSFYDLQAAGHITTLPNGPKFIKREFDRIFERRADEYLIVNCSNVKPHVFLLSLIAELWRDRHTDVEAFARQYTENYFEELSESQADRLIAFRDKFWDVELSFGKEEDQHAAEQFPTYMSRALISQYMTDKNSPSEAMKWFADNSSLLDQARMLYDMCSQAASIYKPYVKELEILHRELPERAARLFEDSLLLQARILYQCYKGAADIAQSVIKGFDGDYINAFMLAGNAREAFLQGDADMRACEHDKWKSFYENEALSDLAESAYLAEGLMHAHRCAGDGPDFWRWQKQFCDKEEDRRVVMLLNFRKHMTNEQIYERISRERQ